MLPLLVAVNVVIQGLDDSSHFHGRAAAAVQHLLRKFVELALDLLGLKELFSTTVCGCDVERGKPEPDVFLKAAERLGLEPANCLVAEDAPAGIEAAHRAGMPAVAIQCPYQSADLSAADRQVESFDECTEPELRTLIKEHES